MLFSQFFYIVLTLLGMTAMCISVFLFGLGLISLNMDTLLRFVFVSVLGIATGLFLIVAGLKGRDSQCK